MKKTKLSRDWHREHRMPAKATVEQRLEWHLEHAKYCGCRLIPVKVTDEIEKRGICAPNLMFHKDTAKRRGAS